MVDVNSDVNERDSKEILYLCSAQLMHSVGFHIYKKFKLNKEVRKLFYIVSDLYYSLLKLQVSISCSNLYAMYL